MVLLAVRPRLHGLSPIEAAPFLRAIRPPLSQGFEAKLAALSPEEAAAVRRQWEAGISDAQAEILYDRHMTKLVSGGYRGGKSDEAAKEAFFQTLSFISLYKRQAAGKVGWLVGSDYEKCRPEFEYLQEWFPMCGYKTGRPTKRVDPGYIPIPVPGGGEFIIKTKSAQDPTSLGMEGPIFIVLCEAAHVTQDVYYRLDSRISEARARYPGFGLFILEGTMEGSLGWFPTLVNKWRSPDIQDISNSRSFYLPSHANPFLYPGGEKDPEILRLQQSQTPEKYSEKHLGVPTPPSGRVHSLFDVIVHVKPCKYNPDLPVYIGIDPGYSGEPSHYVVLAAQIDPESRQWRVFDLIYEHHFTVQEICNRVRSSIWWGNKDKVAVIDVAGAAHAGAQEPNADIWRKTLDMRLLHQKISIENGIRRLDSMLLTNPRTGLPGLVMDPSCQGLTSELGGDVHPTHKNGNCSASENVAIYRYFENQAGKVSGKTPRDEHNDAVKALTYLIVNVIGYATNEHTRAARGTNWKDRKPVAASV